MSDQRNGLVIRGERIKGKEIITVGALSEVVHWLLDRIDYIEKETKKNDDELDAVRRQLWAFIEHMGYEMKWQSGPTWEFKKRDKIGGKV